MTNETLKQIARREVELFEGRGEASLAADLFTPDYRLHFAGMPALPVAGHIQLLAAFREAFPDLRITIEAQIAERDCVVNHLRLTGTHRGPFQGLPATGRSIDCTATNIMRFEGDRIAELWGQPDSITMMTQLGAMPPDPERAPLPPLSAAGTRSDPEDAKAAVRRFVAAFNAKNVDAIAAEYSEKYVLDFPGGPKGRGLAGVRAATREFMATFPDLNFSVDRLVGEGDLVAWQWTLTGTQRGALGPFPASGRPVRVGGISLLRAEAGKIVEDRVRADVVGMLQQIGVLPVPA